MLSSEVTIYDIMFILFMITNTISLFAGRCWGYSDGVDDGARMRRRSDRAIRRGLIDERYIGR